MSVNEEKLEAEPKASEAPDDTRCGAITGKGLACRLPAGEDGRCWRHKGQSDGESELDLEAPGPDPSPEAAGTEPEDGPGYVSWRSGEGGLREPKDTAHERELDLSAEISDTEAIPGTSGDATPFEAEASLSDDPEDEIEMTDAPLQERSEADLEEIGEAEFGIRLETEKEAPIPAMDRESAPPGIDAPGESGPEAPVDSEQEIELDEPVDYPEFKEPPEEVMTASRDPLGEEADVDASSPTPPARGDSGGKKPDTGRAEPESEPREPGRGEPLSAMMVFQEAIRIWNRRVEIPISLMAMSGLLVVCIFVAFFFGTKGPFIKPALTPEVPVITGIRVIDTETVNGVVSNAEAGPLFVIKGKVVNESPSARSHIHVAGTLFTRNGFSKTETAYCGNMLSDTELAILDLEAIRKRLSNRNGTVASNVHVETGRELPFMIIFSDLPEDLDRLERFSVDIAGAYP